VLAWGGWIIKSDGRKNLQQGKANITGWSCYGTVVLSKEEWKRSRTSISSVLCRQTLGIAKEGAWGETQSTFGRCFIWLNQDF